MTGYNVDTVANLKAVSTTGTQTLRFLEEKSARYRFISGDTLPNNDEWIIRSNDNNGNWYPEDPIRGTVAPTAASNRPLTYILVDGSGVPQGAYYHPGDGSTTWTFVDHASSGGSSDPELINFTTGDEVAIPGQWFESSAGNYKPMYQKVIDVGALPNSTSKLVAHGLTFSDLEARSIRTYGVIVDTAISQAIPFPFTTRTGNSSNFTIDATDVTVSTETDMTRYDGTVYIEYAKVSDATTTTPSGNGGVAGGGGGNYTLLEDEVLLADSPTFTLSTFPQTYDDIFIEFYCVSDATVNALRGFVNGDTTLTNYKTQRNGAGNSSAVNSESDDAFVGIVSNSPVGSTMYNSVLIKDYTNSSLNAQLHCHTYGNAGSGVSYAIQAFVEHLALGPVTDFQFSAPSGNFVANRTRVKVYGITYEGSGFSASSGGVVLQEGTTAAGQATIDLNNIDQTYDDIALEFYARSENSSGGLGVNLFANGDTVASNYHRQRLHGFNNGSSNTEGNDAFVSIAANGAGPAGFFVFTRVEIADYTNTTRNKVFRSRIDGPIDTNTGITGNYAVTVDTSTAAIGSLQVVIDGDNFAAGCEFRLLGYKRS